MLRPAEIHPRRSRERFGSRNLDLWAYQRGVTLDFSRAGKPTDNAFIESFNGKFRSECLNAHWFMCLAHATEKCDAWCRDYNEVRPHSAIGNKPRPRSSNGQRRTDPADRNKPENLVLA
ncbi:MAG: transposase [Hyphomicrobium sp.]|nr:transposase [Hyphomicrobium sp.]